MGRLAGSLAVGVDLGATTVKLGLVDDAGSVTERAELPSGAGRDPRELLAEIAERIREALLPLATRAVVGVGVAGQVDPATGAIRRAPNLDWRDFPLGDRLREALGAPVAVLNDVSAATYGEWRFGAGRGVDDLVCLFLGTGIGGGVVADGRLLLGCTGTAAELGHLTVDLHGPPCTCGNYGCVEAFAGGWALARRAQELVASDPAAGGVLSELTGGRPERITAQTIAEAAHRGDALASQLIREAGEALGAGVASMVNAFNPTLLILGGGVLEGLPELLNYIRQILPRRAIAAALKPLRIVTSELGSDAGTVGAAAWARHKLTKTGVAVTEIDPKKRKERRSD